MKNSADLGGCYPPPPSASVDNTLLDLQNSSYPTQHHSIIAKYTIIDVWLADVNNATISASSKYGQQQLNRCKPHRAALKRQKTKIQLNFFFMQYRSFVNNYSIDKLQICIKRSVVNFAEHYVRAKSSPTFLCYYIVLCKFVEMQMRLDMMKIRAFKKCNVFLFSVRTSLRLADHYLGILSSCDWNTFVGTNYPNLVFLWH